MSYVWIIRNIPSKQNKISTKKKLKIAPNYAVIYFGKCFLFFFVDTDARNFEQNFENYHTFRYTRFMPITAKKIRILSDIIFFSHIFFLVRFPHWIIFSRKKKYQQKKKSRHEDFVFLLESNRQWEPKKKSKNGENEFQDFQVLQKLSI